jgi:hypothetical protein
MIPLFSINEVCTVCRKACLDNFGDHVVKSFLASNTGTTLFEMSFLMFLGVQEYLQKKRRL